MSKKSRLLCAILTIGMIFSAFPAVYAENAGTTEAIASAVIAEDSLESYYKTTTTNTGSSVAEYKAANSIDGLNGGTGFKGAWYFPDETKINVRYRAANNSKKYNAYFHTTQKYTVTRELSKSFTTDGTKEYYASMCHAGSVGNPSSNAQYCNPKLHIGSTELSGAIIWDRTNQNLKLQVSAKDNDGTEKTSTSSVALTYSDVANNTYKIILKLSFNIGTEGKDVLSGQVIKDGETPKAVWDCSVEFDLPENSVLNTFAFTTASNWNNYLRGFVLEEYDSATVSAVKEALVNTNGKITAISDAGAVINSLPAGIGRDCILSQYGARQTIAYSDFNYGQTTDTKLRDVRLPIIDRGYGFGSGWAIENTNFTSIDSNAMKLRYANKLAADPYRLYLFNKEHCIYRKLAEPIDLTAVGNIYYFNYIVANNKPSNTQVNNQKGGFFLGSKNNFVGTIPAGDKETVYFGASIAGEEYKTNKIVCKTTQNEDCIDFNYLIKVEPTAQDKQTVSIKSWKTTEAEPAGYDMVIKDVNLGSEISYIGYGHTIDNTAAVLFGSVKIEKYPSSNELSDIKAALGTQITKPVYDENIKDKLNNISDGFAKSEFKNEISQKISFEEFDYLAAEPNGTKVSLNPNKNGGKYFDGGLGWHGYWAGNKDGETAVTAAYGKDSYPVIMKNRQGRVSYMTIGSASDAANQPVVYRRFAKGIDLKTDGEYYITARILDSVIQHLKNLNTFLYIGSDNLYFGLKADEAKGGYVLKLKDGTDEHIANKLFAPSNWYKYVLRISVSKDGKDKLYLKVFGENDSEQGAWDIEKEVELGEGTLDYIAFKNYGLTTYLDDIVVERYEDEATVNNLKSLDTNLNSDTISSLPNGLAKNAYLAALNFADDDKVSVVSSRFVNNIGENIDDKLSDYTRGLYASAEVKNATSTAKNATVIMALYRGEELVKVLYKTKEIPAKSYSGNISIGYFGTDFSGDKASVGDSFAGSDDIQESLEQFAGCTVKTFVWDDFQGLKPLGGNKEITVKAQ